MTPRPALLICNPLSGGRDWTRRLGVIEANLSGSGFRLEVTKTRAAGHATELAAQAVEGERFEAVFGLGGDGTLREIAIGLLGSAVPLGILPGGTTNVLALSLAVPTNAGAASRCYEGRQAELSVIEFDVGMCGEHPFLMMVSAGIDALVLSRASQASKKRWGKLAIGGQALSAIREYTYPEFTLSSEGRSRSGSFAVVSNIPHYGGDFSMAPRARYNDRLLDLGVFAGSGTPATLGFYLDLAITAHDRRPDVDLWQSPTAHLEGQTAPDRTALLQLDGDPMRLPLPQPISIHEKNIKILAPAK